MKKMLTYIMIIFMTVFSVNTAGAFSYCCCSKTQQVAASKEGKQMPCHQQAKASDDETSQADNSNNCQSCDCGNCQVPNYLSLDIVGVSSNLEGFEYNVSAISRLISFMHFSIYDPPKYLS